MYIYLILIYINNIVYICILLMQCKCSIDNWTDLFIFISLFYFMSIYLFFLSFFFYQENVQQKLKI